MEAAGKSQRLLNQDALWSIYCYPCKSFANTLKVATRPYQNYLLLIISSFLTFFFAYITSKTSKNTFQKFSHAAFQWHYLFTTLCLKAGVSFYPLLTFLMLSRQLIRFASNRLFAGLADRSLSLRDTSCK